MAATQCKPDKRGFSLLARTFRGDKNPLCKSPDDLRSMTDMFISVESVMRRRKRKSCRSDASNGWRLPCRKQWFEILGWSIRIATMALAWFRD